MKISQFEQYGFLMTTKNFSFLEKFKLIFRPNHYKYKTKETSRKSEKTKKLPKKWRLLILILEDKLRQRKFVKRDVIEKVDITEFVVFDA